MEEVMAVYAQRGAARLADEGMLATAMAVTAGTSRFAAGEGSFPATTIRFVTPTQDPITMVRAAVATRHSARQGASYFRAGFMFSGLEPAGSSGMLDVFGDDDAQPNVGGVLGKVRSKFGNAAIGIGIDGLAQAPQWSRKRSGP